MGCQSIAMLPRNIFIRLPYSSIVLGPVVRRPISANLRLNFNLGVLIPLFKCIFGIMSCVLFRASKSRVIDKKNLTEFFF